MDLLKFIPQQILHTKKAEKKVPNTQNNSFQKKLETIKPNFLSEDQVVFQGKKHKKSHKQTSQKQRNPQEQINKNSRVLTAVNGLKNPNIPAIQMKIRGVTNFQKSSESDVDNINKMAGSNWKDGDSLKIKWGKSKSGETIDLHHPIFGKIGRVPDEIAKIIKPVIKGNDHDFRFELSNIVAGTTKGAETIGLRANLKYVGKDENTVKEAFNRVLEDKECSKSTYFYQPPTSPEKVLQKIFDYETRLHDKESANKMAKNINNIVAQIKEPKNKNILLLGHRIPDGDTIGCVLGLKNAIDLMHADKHVDCAIDDKMPGLFRGKLPGIEDMKHPENPEKENKIIKNIKEFEEKIQNKTISEETGNDQIKLLKNELKEIKNPEKVLNPPKEGYDLVVLMDIPTPTRFTDKFHDLIQNANEAIYIDHHPHRIEEWEKMKDFTGLDMKKVHEHGLAWIADKVPAAAQEIGIIASKIIPNFDKISQAKGEDQTKLRNMVADLIVGMYTDTGCYSRTANLTPEDVKDPFGNPVPVDKKPNFLPEGMAKFLMNLTKNMSGKQIDKKWLRENISYDISDNKHGENIKGSARDMMLQASIDGKIVHEDLSLGIIQVDYDTINEVWAEALNDDQGISLLDVENSFKYSEAMGILRANPENIKGKAIKGYNELSTKAREDYKGDYDNDRIAIYICQDKKADALDENLGKAKQNGLRLSLRSIDGTNHAEFIATLFGGGGHGGAAGGRVDLPGVELISPLAIKINDKLETNMSNVYKAIEHNLKTKTQDKNNIELVMSDNGKPCADIIKDLVKEIRIREPEPKSNANKSENHNKTHNKKRTNNNHKSQFQQNKKRAS